MLFKYDESGTKSALYPRHPLVCYLDIAGIVATTFFFFQSEAIAVQGYLFSIVLLYAFSTLHHWISYADWSRRLDHIMIFAVIAMSAMPYWGAYPPLQWTPAGPILIVAIIALGMIAKLVSFFPKILSSLLYTAAGLPMVVDFLWNWSSSPEPYNFLWIFGVGLYSFQMLIYTFEWFNFKKELFGFREVQHLTLLAATTLHSVIALQLVG